VPTISTSNGFVSINSSYAFNINASQTKITNIAINDGTAVIRNIRRVNTDTIRGEIFPFVRGRTYGVSITIECRTLINPNNLSSITKNPGVNVQTI
jgi:hypothetical protein